MESSTAERVLRAIYNQQSLDSLAGKELLTGVPKSINPAQLAEQTREKRAAYGLSIRQAAEDTGVSPATFSRIVHGDHLPDYERLLLLAQ
ncbi:MAG: helix-turn-helix domain-containing protein [Ktedonobacterales bacterium]